MTRFFTVVIITAIPILLFLYLAQSGFNFSTFFGVDRPLVELGDTPISVEVFDTEQLRVQGLSGRESLPTNGGALFIFDEAEYHGIWMKDMFLSLDIIWIDEAFKIVHIEKNVHPGTYPHVFEPDMPARFVIEIASRFTDTYNITEGDRVTIPKGLVPEDLRE